MKILWISHFLPYPPHGGSAQRNYNLLSELSKESKVYKIGFMQSPHHSNNGEKKVAISKISEICESLWAYDIPSDYNRLHWYALLCANILSRKPYSGWRFHSIKFEQQLNSLLEQEEFDIVYADIAATAHYALRAKGKAKLVLNHHNVESSLLFRRAEKTSNPAARWYLNHQGTKMKKWEAAVCPQFDINLTVSDFDADLLRSYTPGARYEVISNGSDIDYFTPSGSVTGHELIYVGGGTWLPNRDAMSWFVEKIFPKIVSRMPDTVMHVIGRNPPKNVLDASKRDSRIKVYGFVPDIRPYLARSAVYVVPIRVGGGTRLKILDAFASGKAVVSTSIGCEGIYCKDGENIRVADTPECFSDIVIDLLCNNKERDRLGKNARALVEKTYSWPIIGARLREVYQSLTL